jgi:hypothetical protein
LNFDKDFPDWKSFLTPKVCQADGGRAEPSKDLIEKAFLCFRRLYFGADKQVLYEQNREYGAKL